MISALRYCEKGVGKVLNAILCEKLMLIYLQEVNGCEGFLTDLI